ncbi:hypothetical protein BBJ28_00008718 [Nothophytophthora sp. Chile5]|nr:hypothetical protein BBJ28_00008718 [Nothophytophthora sp. Chile5]
MASDATERRLALGVKGRLSALEMAQLRRQLAQAAAPGHQLQTRPAAAGGKPVTQRYRRVEPEPRRDGRVARPGRKTLASIQHERQFQGDDATSRLRPTRGLPSDAKQLLQDEYVAKPRAVSVIPRAFTTSKDDDHDHDHDQRSGGRRRGPDAVPQVFLM